MHSMLYGTALQIPTRPKKVAGDMSARFGRSDGFRQQGSMNRSDARPFLMCRLQKAAPNRANM